MQLRGLEPAQRLLLDRLFTWIAIGNLHVDVAFQLDPLSAVMILVVTGVGGLIHIYSTGYMHEEPAYWRYFAYLNLFTFAMLTLVLADNLLLMFVGWEGVGLCSWALIGFWYSDWNNATAGNKAFIVNRVGDFGFMLGTFLLFWALAGIGHPTRRPSARSSSSAPSSRATPCAGFADADGGDAADVRRRHRQVGADPALRLAARRDGRSDAGVAR